MNRFGNIVLAMLLLLSCTMERHEADTGSVGESKILNAPVNVAPGRLLVKVNSSTEGFVLEEIDGIPVCTEPLFPRTLKNASSVPDRWYLLEFDHDADVRSLASAVAADARVEYIQYDTFVEPVCSEPMVPAESSFRTRAVASAVRSEETLPFDDPELPWQWHFYNDASLDADYDNFVAGADINVLEAWKYSTGDRRVVVAVLDGGVMYSHEDLAGNMWVNEAERDGMPGVDDDGNGYVDDVYGYNFYDNKGTVEYEETTMRSHGTHVAGTIAAVNNNGRCVSGIAGGSGNSDGCRVMACQIFHDGNPATESAIASAIRYAADNGAVMINNSWAYPSGAYTSDSRFKANYSVLMDAFRYFEQNGGYEGLIDGGLMIFAAGNDGSDVPSYPGAYYGHICVTAMGPDFRAASYANYGTGVNICAPGGEQSTAGFGTVHGISSTTADEYGYGYMQGTSMAAPHVTGCAALGLSYALEIGRSFTLDEFKSMILTSVHDVDQYQTGTRYSYVSGSWGYLDLSAYAGRLGAGYIDAHRLLMQVEGTPCLYFAAGTDAELSLAAQFGGGSGTIVFTGVTADAAMEALGIENIAVEDGLLKVRCTKTGTARVSVSAIVGGSSVGGGDSMGGMAVTRDIMLVVRRNVAENGGWL